MSLWRFLTGLFTPPPGTPPIDEGRARRVDQAKQRSDEALQRLECWAEAELLRKRLERMSGD